MERLTVLVDEPIGRIRPELHGHFVEHVGAMIDGGLWVGPDSEIPNAGGVRLDVIDALRPLAIPVLRWPGGCFADGYHWRDGVGPSRPLRVNHHWGFSTETNAFGTHEFLALCRTLGATPYLAANVGSSSPSEMRDWVEYCNFAGDSSLTRLRRENGAAEPFRVPLWGIGNEAWGCGGTMTASEYAAQFCRFRTFLPAFPGAPVEAIACGPDGPDWAWTEELFSSLRGRLHLVQHLAAHFYCGTAGTATAYSLDEWTALLTKAREMERIITGHRGIMDRFDPERRIGLAIDEWGTWHPPTEGRPPRGLWQQNTMRDALAAAITLDVFHRHAHVLTMANLAQLVNVLQAPLLVEGGHVIRTPTWHVLELYRPHRGRMSVRVVHEVTLRGTLERVHASASVDGESLCLTLCNTDPVHPAGLMVQVPGMRDAELEARILVGESIHAHNTVDDPQAVHTRVLGPVALRGGVLSTEVPAASVVRLLSGPGWQ